MTIEQWQEYPHSLEVISRSQFFDELRDNLKAVIRDYVGLGIENEDQLLARADTLFTGELVPSRQDWQTLDALLHELANVKEIGPLYRNFFQDAADSLGVSDLAHIRSFLDTVQSMPPRDPAVRISMPAPNRTYLNKPTFSSTDSYQGNLKLDWDVNADSVATKSATITGTPSASEDILHYDLVIEAGTQRWEKRFTPNESIQYTLPLQWSNWFTPQELHRASLRATLVATDKRGNTSTATHHEQYPADVFMPSNIVTYEAQYQINAGSWVRLANIAGTSHTWNPLPKIDGTYRFRVRGTDALGRTYGGYDAGSWSYTDWAYSDNLALAYIPAPPEKPNPTYTSTWNTITISWDPCARADYYEVHNWADTQTAKNNSVDGNSYYKKVLANETRRVTLSKFSADNWHGIYVRAVNAGGETVGYISCKTKARVLVKKTYESTGSAVWRGEYKFLDSNGKVAFTTDKVWRDEKDVVYQGEWKEVTLGGWRQRGGNGSYYMAYDGNTWGNNMSFFFLDYNRMASEMKNKTLTKVTISINRSTAGAHGFAEASPLYLYNHNRYSNRATVVQDGLQPFTLYRADNHQAVNYHNQKSAANVKFDRGETEKIANEWTKQLVQNIVDGKMRGLGIVKYYGSYFNTNATYSDTAYMRLSGKIKIEVEYYDD